jgi:prefoldin subunit 5
MPPTRKLHEAVSQLAKEYKTIQTDLEVLEANLETVNQNIENSAAQTPRIIVSEKLWSGTEVIISKRRRRFTKNRTGVKVQLSENEAIIALNLA